MAAVVLPGPCFAGPLLSDAAKSVASGDRPGAAGLLAAWLEANPGAPGGARVLDSYLAVEQDLGRALKVSLQFLATSSGIPGAAPQLDRVARLLSLAGRVQEARDAYLAAYRAGGADADLLKALLLTVEMNDVSSMAGDLAAYRARGGAHADLYDAIIALVQGDAAGADLLLTGSPGDDDLALKAAWMTYIHALQQGDSGAATKAASALSTRFPGSPEASIAAGGAGGEGSTVVSAYPVPEPAPAAATPAPAPAVATTPAAPAPGVVLPEPAVSAPAVALSEPAVSAPGVVLPEPAVPPPAEATPGASPPAASAPPPADTRMVAVQVGSFRVRENADDLVKDLLSKGFTPVVREQAQDGKSLYRVFAAGGISNTEAATVLDRLRQLGYGGLIVSSW